MSPFCDRHEQYYQQDVATGEWRCPDCPLLPDTPAVSPVSRPVDLEAWERLARAAIDAREALRQAQLAHEPKPLGALRITADGSRILFDRACTPERILGLIGEVRRSQSVHEQKQNDEG